MKYWEAWCRIYRLVRYGQAIKWWIKAQKQRLRSAYRVWRYTDASTSKAPAGGSASD
jgi:hypothetical protein